MRNKEFQGYIVKKLIICILLPILILNKNTYAACQGGFINPITDICWSCMFPMTIGGAVFGDDTYGRVDTANPDISVCACWKKVNTGYVSVPVPGVAMGFWEPVNLVDVTRTPYCMVGLGGINLSAGFATRNGFVNKSYTESGPEFASFYHTHYYIYPLIYWLSLITDVSCLDQGSLDVAYMSELDPTYNDDVLNLIMNPESVLFSNSLAQIACTADCIAANTHHAINKMFWCAGCSGSLYPLNGFVTGGQGGMQISTLLATRTIAKLHRLGLALETSTDVSERLNGPLCKKRYAPFLKKSQYKLQMVYPVADTEGKNACFPIGMTDFVINSQKEYPVKGEDFSYVVWRKKNCCAL